MGKRECSTKLYCIGASNYIVGDQSDLVLKITAATKLKKNVSLIS